MLTQRLPRLIGGTTRTVCGCKHFGLWLCVSCHFHLNLRAFSFCLFLVLQKRMRSPLTGTTPCMSPSMHTLLKRNDDNNPNHNSNRKPTYNPS